MADLGAIIIDTQTLYIIIANSQNFWEGSWRVWGGSFPWKPWGGGG